MTQDGLVLAYPRYDPRGMSYQESKTSQENTGERLAKDSDRCPLIRVERANEHGIVIQSRRSLEVGSAFALGIHVHIPEARQTEFVSAETIIVESSPRLNRLGDLVYSVTMLFSEITRDDRELLVLVSHDESMLAPPQAGSRSVREISSLN